ncbi:MAG: hypothetical protein AB1705_18000 [Verrucomicrobiota bacterium]
MSFEGRFEFDGPEQLNAALAAFDEWREDSLVQRAELKLEETAVAVSFDGYAPASMWLPTQGAITQLADAARAGSVVCKFFGDEVETEVILAEPLRPKPPPRPRKPEPPPPLEVPPLALVRVNPRARFSVRQESWWQGETLFLEKPKFYRCAKCGHRTRLTPAQVLPPWPMEKSGPSAFDRVLETQFDRLFPAKAYRFDFFCGGCHAPVRLLFNILETRSSAFRAEVHSVVETPAEGA